MPWTGSSESPGGAAEMIRPGFALLAAILSSGLVPGPAAAGEQKPLDPGAAAEAPREGAAPVGPGIAEKGESKKDRGGRPAGTAAETGWDKLSPAEREKLREIYQRLGTLSPAERKALLDRLRNMTPEERRRAIEKARQKLREKSKAAGDAGAKGAKKAIGPKGDGEAASKKRTKSIRTVPSSPRVVPTAQKAVLDSLARWKDGLPSEMRERIRFLTRREQLEIFRSFRESESLGRAFPDAGERDHLLGWSAEKLKGLVRGGLRPEGISESSWERWRGLQVLDRQLAVRRLVALREEKTGGPRPAAGGKSDSGTAKPGAGSGAPGRGQK
jgi:hypothetical protein